MPETGDWLRATSLRGRLTLRRPMVLAGLAGYVAFLVLALYALRGVFHEALPISLTLSEAAARWAQLASIGLPAVLATAIAGNRESRQLQTRATAGERPLAQLATTVALTLLLGAGTWVLGMVVAVVFSVIDQAVDPVPSSHAYDLPTGQLLTTMSRAPALTLVMSLASGVIVGLVARTAMAAVSCCVVLGGAGQLVVLVAEGLIGVVGWVAVLTPSGIADAGGGGLIPPQQADAAFVALLVTTLAVVAALVITWRRGCCVTISPPRVRRVARSPRARSRHRLVLGVATGIVVALVWGLVLPIALRSQVPWQLRPAWIADVHAHRSSEDIARRFLADVHAGHTASAGRYTRSASPGTLLGPYLPTVRAEKPALVYVVQRPWGDPGTVTVQYATYGFDLCMQRDTSGWYVQALNTTGSCPKVTIG